MKSTYLGIGLIIVLLSILIFVNVKADQLVLVSNGATNALASNDQIKLVDNDGFLVAAKMCADSTGDNKSADQCLEGLGFGATGIKAEQLKPVFQRFECCMTAASFN